MSLVFIKMVLAHVLGDFVLQPDKWVNDKLKKKHKSKYLYFHILVHTAALLIVFGLNMDYWLVFLTLPLSHFLIDLIKLNLQKESNQRWLFLVDQIAHFGVISAMLLYYFPDSLATVKWFSERNLLILLCMLILTFAGSIIIQVLMSRWIVKEDEGSQSLPEAGKYIGMIERLFIFGFVLLNQWSAIGFLIAAKSVFRFGDLSRAKDRKLTEYILIGTLLSFGFAILTGLFFNQFCPNE